MQTFRAKVSGHSAHKGPGAYPLSPDIGHTEGYLYFKKDVAVPDLCKYRESLQKVFDSLKGWDITWCAGVIIEGKGVGADEGHGLRSIHKVEDAEVVFIPGEGYKGSSDEDAFTCWNRRIREEGILVMAAEGFVFKESRAVPPRNTEKDARRRPLGAPETPRPTRITAPSFRRRYWKKHESS